jgi:DNA-directed RNA polymerase subunit N (RpoN/RPB10)
MMQEDANYRRDLYQELAEKRSERRRFTKEHDEKLDDLGVKRYKKDKRMVEEYIEKVKHNELERAKDSYLKLHASMDMTDKKQQEALESWNTQVEESRSKLAYLDRKFKSKEDVHNRTL